MFIVLLKFSDNKASASELMDGHNAWLMEGFRDGVFLLAGSLQPGLGGGIIAHNTTLDILEARLNEDPFIVEDVVKPEIIELSPAKADKRLQFLVK